MNKYLRFLKPEFMLTPQVFVAVFLWSAILHFADLRNNPPVQVAERAIALLVATAASFAAIWLLSAIWRKWVNEVAVWKWMLPTAIVGTAIRGLIFSGILRWIEYPTLASVFVRGTASVYSVLFALLASTVALGVVRTHAATRSRLMSEQRRLRLVKQRAMEQLQDLDEGLAQSIKADLHAAISEIGASQGALVLAKLRETIDDVVRPLSHYLQQRSAQWNLPEIESAELRVRWGDVLREGLRVDRIMPLTNSSLLVIAGIPTMAQRYSLLATVLTSAAGMLVGVGAFAALKAAVRRLSHSWGDVAQALMFVATLTLIGALMGSVTLPLTLTESEPPALVWIAALFTPLGGILVALAVTGTQELEKADHQLEQATEDLAWETARTRAFYRQRQRALTHALHGQVQASLSAAYLRLSPLAEDEASLARELPKVSADLDRVVEQISTAPESVDDCGEVVAKVAANWEGVAAVSYRIAPTADLAAKSDTLARTVLVDLIPELCFNAVKHGNAREIDIAIDLLDPRTLRLSVCNNGTSPQPSVRKGLGTALLEECTVHWSRGPNAAGGGACVTADIPTSYELPSV